MFKNLGLVFVLIKFTTHHASFNLETKNVTLEFCSLPSVTYFAFMKLVSSVKRGSVGRLSNYFGLSKERLQDKVGFTDKHVYIDEKLGVASLLKGCRSKLSLRMS